MASRQKRNGIPLDIKYKIIKLIDKKTPRNEILEKFSEYLRSDYSISKIIKNKQK